MKSVNYSFNRPLLVDFMLLWHLKMEAQPEVLHGCTNPGGRQIMRYI